jgi:hypothetical protein
MPQAARVKARGARGGRVGGWGGMDGLQCGHEEEDDAWRRDGAGLLRGYGGALGTCISVHIDTSVAPHRHTAGTRFAAPLMIDGLCLIASFHLILISRQGVDC